MPEESVDLIFADPPYFMQTEGTLYRTDGTKFNGVEDKWDKFSGYTEYDKFSIEWLSASKRVLKKNGAIWVIGSFSNIYRLGYIMQNMGFWILGDIIWAKPNAVPNFSGSRFQNSHETLLWCTKSKEAKYTFNYKTMKYLNGGKQEKSVWNIGICIGKERLKDENGIKVHSTQKPEKLLNKVILSSSKPGDLILDPFFGTGTTGAVAKRLGRNFLGFELNGDYIKYAKKRIDSVRPELTDINMLKKEVKPPKVSMTTLIESGYLIEGQILYNNKKMAIGTIERNGYVNDGTDVLSIHQMSAKHLGLSNYNGWNYFWIVDKNEKFVPLDSLRYVYSGI